MTLNDSHFADPEILSASRRWIKEAVRRDQQNSWDGDADKKLWSKIVDLGWTAVRVPSQYGGIEGTLAQVCTVAEAAGEALLQLPFQSHSIAVELLCSVPPGNCRDNWLREAASGRLAVGQLHQGKPCVFVERTGTGIRVEGRLYHVTGGAQADGLLIKANLSHGPVDDSALILALPTNTPGISMKDHRSLDGRRHAEVTFEEVILPESSVLADGTDSTIAINNALGSARLMICAEACGIARTLLEGTSDYLRTRVQFGQALATFQVLQHRVADMLIAATYARDFTWQQISVNSNSTENIDASQLHLASIQVQLETMRNVRFVAEQAVQLHGGMGVSDELYVSHAFKRVVTLDTIMGTRGELLTLLAEHLKTSKSLPMRP